MRLGTICCFMTPALPSSFQTALKREHPSLEFSTSAATNVGGNYVTQKEDTLFKCCRYFLHCLKCPIGKSRPVQPYRVANVQKY